MAHHYCTALHTDRCPSSNVPNWLCRADIVKTSELTLGLFRPNVEKSKSSGLSLVSPVFSKKVFSSFRDRNLLPLGPMMKTSYRPAEAPLFLWETFLCQP